MNEDGTVKIAPKTPEAATIEVPVQKVFDGGGFLTKVKTYELTRNPKDNSELEASIRFGFIDAPELGQPGGYEAKSFLSSLITNQWLKLVVLTKMDTGGSLDRHGRIVCIPYLTQKYSSCEFKTASSHLHQMQTNGGPLIVTRNIELEMVLNGWAWVLERYGPDERYFEALDDARRNKRGIWSFKNNVRPWEFKKQNYRKKRANSNLELNFDTDCPIENCNGHLVNRNGKYGAFVGCSNFPGCRLIAALC